MRALLTLLCLIVAAVAVSVLGIDLPGIWRSDMWMELSRITTWAMIIFGFALPVVVVVAMLTDSDARGRRLGKTLGTLLLVGWSSFAHLSGVLWYVRPDFQGDYGLEDGTSFDNAFDGNADIGWASIDVADTLILCGAWGPSDARITVSDSGTAGNYITLTGLMTLCPGQVENSSISRAGITGANGRAIAASNTAATRNYIKVEYITLKDCSDYCLLWDYSTTGAVTDDTALWVNRVTFKNCGATGVPVCLRHTGQNFLVEYSTFLNSYNDAIWLQGGGVIIRYNTIGMISNGALGGDGIQIDATGVTDTGTVEIYGNTIDHSAYDVKYCVLAPGRGTSSINIHDNTCNCPAVRANATQASSCHGYTLDVVDTTVVKVERNYVRGGEIGISINGNTATNFTTRARVVGNVVTGAFFWGILTDGYINNIDIFHNTVNAAGDTAIDIRKNSTDNATAISIGVVNNIMTNSALGLSYANHTPSPRGYNNYFGNTANVEANAVAGTTTTGDITTDPQFVGGTSPTDAQGFRLKATSPARRVGFDFNIGNVYQDNGNRAYLHPPTMGAWETTSGDVAPERTVRP